jgi:hypothetical protein
VAWGCGNGGHGLLGRGWGCRGWGCRGGSGRGITWELFDETLLEQAEQLH